MKVRITIRDLRLAEMAGVLLLIAAVGSLLSIGSYSPHDPSANVAATNAVAENWMGIPGAYFADLVLQLLGLGAFSLPIGLAISGVWTLRGKGYEHAGWIFVGMSLLMVVFCCAPADGGGTDLSGSARPMGRRDQAGRSGWPSAG